MKESKMASNSWIPAWLRGDKDEDKDKDKDKDKEVPKALKDAIADSVKAATSPIEERLKGLDSLTDFAKQYKEDRNKEEQARKDKEAELKAKKDKENETTDEDLAALLLSDPKKAINEMTKGQTTLLLTMRADQLRDQVFRDRDQEFPYYSGEVKTEIDKILSEQPLSFRNDPRAIENTYYTVVGKKQKEISEGKIKSRFASGAGGAGSGSGKGTGGEPGDDFKIEVSPDIIKAAKQSGMELNDYVKLVEKAAKAGEIDYVN